ncbi:peptidylprolyl isomerase [Pseudomonas sp. 5P_3.1_Bac2]|uniref:peptidylprolyl isomerase n=1 Tax=Pseudomonas sp. 5P_3.1_Bac2 TaxID=2971617 RepID=UPI0021C9C112|nr:peptidylprolyl isomerase [Pseudomonas sp. 5P_3.1_Bac2]MCU1717246.1 peptidylprolyl isomerase [Pseudomonas sp. 5P_3.1_Bac2]
MARTTLWLGAGALTAVALAVALWLRPTDAPVTAVAQTAPPVKDSSAVVARLGDQQVSADELHSLLAQLPAATRDALKGERVALENWLRARLAEKSLYQQAEAQQWAARPEVQAQIRAAIEQIVLRNYLNSVTQVPEDFPSEEALQQAYEANKGALQVAASYRLSQIFLTVPAPQAAESVYSQALALSQKAQAKDADFAELARRYSQEQVSAERGGDIGLQPLRQLIPEIRSSVSQLEVGQVSAPIKTPLGFHIIQLTELQPARQAGLAEVRGQLRETLRASQQEQAAQKYLRDMFNNATLSLDGAALSKVLQQPD